MEKVVLDLISNQDILRVDDIQVLRIIREFIGGIGHIRTYGNYSLYAISD